MINSKKTPEQMAGRKDKKMLFIGSLWPPQGSNKYNCSKTPFKSQRCKCNIGLTKNYCISVSMQKISSIHMFILMIQLILESRELNKWPHPSLTSSFYEFATACKKLVYSSYSCLRYSQY